MQKEFIYEDVLVLIYFRFSETGIQEGGERMVHYPILSYFCNTDLLTLTTIRCYTVFQRMYKL